MNERVQLEDLGLDGMIVLKWILINKGQCGLD